MRSNQESVLPPSYSAAPLASNRQRAAFCGTTGLLVLFHHTSTGTATPFGGQDAPSRRDTSLVQRCKNAAKIWPMPRLSTILSRVRNRFIDSRASGCRITPLVLRTNETGPDSVVSPQDVASASKNGGPRSIFY
jgi:hypothetical protein